MDQDQQIQDELQRLRNIAARKRDMLLVAAHQHTHRRKRFAMAAGILALLSAATVTSVLADFTPAPIMKVIAALLSTIAGLISLFSNIGFKDSEILELYTGASRYLNLRERAQRISLNPDIDVHQKFKALEELQDLYAELDLQFQRYIVATASDSSRIGSAAVSSYPDDNPEPRRGKPLGLGSQAASDVAERIIDSGAPEDNPADHVFGRRRPLPDNDDSKMA